MYEYSQQDIINSSFKLSIERENELIEKCKKYKSGNADKNITSLIEGFIQKSENNIDKISSLVDKLALDYTSSKKIILTELDKLQILLRDKIHLQKLYNDLSIKNQNPEVRKLFIQFRDSQSDDIYNIQRLIQHAKSATKPVSKSIK